MTQNRLHLETSPYLLQHQDNPVHWWSWGPKALAHAQSENKPILLSVGYSTCHWCHVMAHESFENQVVADVMNAHYINIKVDREERPDLDAFYQAALRTLNQNGGWPLTMVLTPAGEPFWGGTYFPREPRYGFPGFINVLENISEAWVNDQTNIRQNVEAIEAALNRQQGKRSNSTLTYGGLDQVAKILLSNSDLHCGGFKGAPKFPQAPILRFLWQAGLRQKEPRLLDQVHLTLAKMSDGGIYDHVGGGFARYATDEHWLIPHFEKMLYDNALLITQLCISWTDTKCPLYKTRVYETINWALRDLATKGPDGTSAFATALNADSEGEEGLYYVWSAAEIDALLKEQSDLFKSVYDVKASGNWSEAPLRDSLTTCILNRPDPTRRSRMEEEILHANLQALLQEREKRVAPSRDDKVLADLNGMMIQALVRAAQVFANPAWFKAAQAAFHFVCTQHTKKGRMMRSWAQGEAKNKAVLDDLAQMCAAALILYEHSGELHFLDQAKIWVEEVEVHFADSKTGVYFFSADDVTDILTRSQLTDDHATPSGNGIFAEVLARLFLISGEDVYGQRCEKLIQAMTSNDPGEIAHRPSVLMAYDLLAQSRQVVVVGEGCEKLVSACFLAPSPNFVIVHGGDKPALNHQPTAYVCSRSGCLSPITSAEDLLKALNSL